MEFGSSKDGFVEEDQEEEVIIGDMGKKLKLPLSSSSASASSFSPSSSPSPSSSHYRNTTTTSSTGVHHHQQQQQYPQQPQQQTSTTEQQQQWRGSQMYHHQQQQQQQYPQGDSSSSLRFHGGYYEAGGANHLIHKQHEFMELSPRSHENMVQAESDVAAGGGGSSSGINNADVICIEREHMFDKVVTPSDVGKLNRLVIPKQHAEKYFPLDSTANEKGLLLSFEDRSGKPWRFRYSYWNSSQSYVMTKGWSRFVKEKKLDAGDIVSFERGANESAKDRLFIDWRRRVNPPDHHLHHHHLGSLPSLSFHNPLSYPRAVPWGRLLMPPNMSQTMSMPREQHLHLQQMNYYDHQRLASSSGSNSSSYGYNMPNPNHPGAVYYLRSSAPQQGHHHHGLVHHQGGEVPMVYDSVPVVQGKAAAKRVRLFGVNLDCPIPEEEDADTTMAPLSLSHYHQHHHQQQQQQQQQLQLQLPPTPLPPHLQLRVYNGAPLPHEPPTELPKRGRPSLSFDLDG